jgi:hypothetical protein
VDIQRKIEGLRRNIRDLDDRIVRLREKQLTAPKDAMLPGLLTDTVDSLNGDIEESKKKIERAPSPRPKARSTRRSPTTACSLRPTRWICCSTACCRAISYALWPSSTRQS